MIDVEKVIERIALLFPSEAEKLADMKEVLVGWCKEVEKMLRHGADADDTRVLSLAAAYCARQMTLTEQESVTSFSAGDISINYGGAKNGGQILAQYMENCHDLIEDSAFAFTVV